MIERMERNMNKWVLLTLAIFSEVVATSSLKSTEGFTKLLPSLIVLFGYGAAFYFLSLTLDTIPIGVAYAVWSGVGVAGIALISVFFWTSDLMPRHSSALDSSLLVLLCCDYSAMLRLNDSHAG